MDLFKLGKERYMYVKTRTIISVTCICTQLDQLWKQSQKIQAWMRFKPTTPTKIRAVLYQLSYQASWEMVTLWVCNIPIASDECKSILFIIIYTTNNHGLAECVWIDTVTCESTGYCLDNYILSHHFLALTFSEDNFGKYHPPYSEHYFSDSMPTMGICKWKTAVFFRADVKQA